jgi:formamidopyrimidine-DNA glycosylase
MTQYGTIQISLGMSGAFVPSSLSSPLPHEHVSICFSDGSVLGYIDPRRFGFWKIQIAHLPHLADPLRKTELIRLFANTQVRKSTRAIKDLLMDQKLIGGIGNIYALEALHISHIRPTRRAHRVLTHEWQSLAESIPTILAQAIDKGGSTVSTYRRLHGEDGNFQELHQVYDREKELCMRSTCTGIIKRVKQGGRSSWYCPKCQK